MIARRAVVSGRVQGVGFRFFADRAARELGVNGWVRNLPDGTVETFVEGPEEAVTNYLQRLRQGPRSGRLASVAAEESAPRGLTSFQITH